MDYEQKIKLAERADTPIEILEELAVDEYYYIRMIVGVNLSTPPKILEQLATDENHYVRACVAGTPNTPIKTLEQLATDENSLVREWVTQNPNRTELIERLVFMTNYKNGWWTDGL